MKKVLYSIGLIVVALTFIFATNTNTTKSYGVDLTPYTSGVNSYVKIGGTTTDTLIANDTATYIILVNRADQVDVFGQIVLDKVGAGKPTVTTYFYQSNDGVNYEVLKKGITRANYTIASGPSLSSDTVINFSFKRDTVYFEGRYLKLVTRTTNISNTSVVNTALLKFNRK